MISTLQAINKSTFAKPMSKQSDDLVAWINQVLEGSFATQINTGMLRNYMHQDGNPAAFPDSAGTALLAGCSYRFAAMGYGNKTIPAADRAFVALKQALSSDGYLTGAVDPVSWERQTDRSAEAQAFVLMLQARHRDYVATMQSSSVASTSASIPSDIDIMPSRSFSASPTSSPKSDAGRLTPSSFMVLVGLAVAGGAASRAGEKGSICARF